MSNFFRLVAIFLAFSSSINAATIEVGGGLVTGISGLVVDSTTYDVSFIEGSFHDVFGSVSPTLDFTTDSEALQAVTAIRDVFASDDTYKRAPGKIRGCSSTSTDFCWILVPYRLSDTHAQSNFARIETTADPLSGRYGALPFAQNDDDKVYAKFSVVPIPAAGYLFVSALAGLWGFRSLAVKTKSYEL